MNSLATQIFSTPEKLKKLSLKQWDLLLRQCRNSDISGKLHALADNKQLLSSIPAAPLTHLKSANTQSIRHNELVHYEIHQIHKALAELDTPVILLKGAAYVAASLPAAKGRFFTDIDIMVHKSRISMAEDALQYAGWMNSNVDDYDEKYYRTWMHEIPPMQHQKRKTILDLHHAILPETARFKPEANKLFKAAVPVEGFSNLYTLCPEDMVLHSATHLFSDGEFEHGLRDLLDIDSLLRYFPEQNPEFWTRLVGRARNLDLTQPLYYALLYCSDILETPIPAEHLQRARAQANHSGPIFQLANRLLREGLQPNHSSCRGPFDGLWMWMLYVRSHYLRMPLKLLLPHLFHKAFISPYNEHKQDQLDRKKTKLHDLLALRNR